MRIATRVLLTQVGIVVVVGVMAVTDWLALAVTDRQLGRMELTNAQLGAISFVSEEANYFNEQVAEYLLIGPPEGPELNGATERLAASLERLVRATAAELVFLPSPGEREEEAVEDRLLERLHATVADLERATDDVVALRETDLAEAVTVYRRRIENGVDRRIEAILAEWLRDERQELVTAESTLRRTWDVLTVFVLTISIATLIVSVALAITLRRAIVRPLQDLVLGAIALRRGGRGVRVRQDGRDELGLLARRFNAMARTLERQHEALSTAKASLERQVVARTSELDSANSRLRILDRLRVQFLTDVSHELRTPLTVIRGEAEVVLRHRGQDESRYRDAMSRIVNVSQEMSRLTDDLLFLARSEADTMQFDFSAVDLDHVMERAVSQLATLADRKQLELVVHPPAEPVQVLGDAQRLQQVIVILVDNAIKYAFVQTEISIRLSVVDEYTELQVENRGPGIDAADLPLVFERYYRGQGCGRVTGSGLGLPIAKAIVEKHGGKISLASEPDGITVVTIGLARINTLRADAA